MRKGLGSSLYLLGSLGLGIAIGAFIYLSRPSREEKQLPIPESSPVQAQEAPLFETYSAKSGDYLSRIAFREFGLRGRSIYDKVLEMQELTWPPEERVRRDTHKVVDGQLVRGQDGLVDLIYPGEEIKYMPN